MKLSLIATKFFTRIIVYFLITDRIENFGIGAVRFGWLGLFIGIIIMSASNIIISLDNIGPALAVALLTPFYGYFINILTNVIVNRMDYNNLNDEQKEIEE